LALKRATGLIFLKPNSCRDFTSVRLEEPVWSSCRVCRMEIGARWRGHPPDTAACYKCRLPFHGVYFWNVNKVYFWNVNEFRYISSIPCYDLFLGLCACSTLFSRQMSPSATLAAVFHLGVNLLFCPAGQPQRDFSRIRRWKAHFKMAQARPQRACP